VEHDPRPQHMLVGAVAVGDDRLEPSTILTKDGGADILGHAPSMPHPFPAVNLQNVTMH
jgi:hypothetical protein